MAVRGHPRVTDPHQVVRGLFCASLCLSIMMLLARKASWALQETLQTLLLSEPGLLLDQSLWLLLWLQDTLQQQPSGNIKKKKSLLLTKPGVYTAYLGSTWWGFREKERGKENKKREQMTEWKRKHMGLGSVFVGVEVGVTRASWIHSVLVSLKHKEGN